MKKIDKFKYLRAYMTGPGKSASGGVRLAEHDFNTATIILNDRFGRSDLLIADHVDAFLAITPVKTSANVERLRSLHDEMAFRLNALKRLGVTPDRYDVTIHHFLLKALPNDNAVLYWQRMKESAANEVIRDTKQVYEILEFFCINIPSFLAQNSNLSGT